MKRNKFKTNKLKTAANQDQSQKPQQEHVFSNLHVSGIQGQTEMKHTDNSSLDQTKPKPKRLQKESAYLQSMDCQREPQSKHPTGENPRIYTVGVPFLASLRIIVK